MYKCERNVDGALVVICGMDYSPGTLIIAILIPVFCVVDVVRAVIELGIIRRDIPVLFV
jgi:hypothetical protein